MNTKEVVEAITEKAPVVKSAIDRLVEQLTEYLETGMDIASDQAPALFEEIVRWGIWSGVLNTFMALPWLLAGVALLMWWNRSRVEWSSAHRKHLSTHAGDIASLQGLLLIATPLLGIFLTIAGTVDLYNIRNILKPLLAPRLYVIEYLIAIVN